MPYWSKGKLGIREGSYTGTQKFHLGSGRSMAYNVLTANTVVPRLCRSLLVLVYRQANIGAIWESAKVKFLESHPEFGLYSSEAGQIRDSLGELWDRL